jgi:thioesterase domain-containing protein
MMHTRLSDMARHHIQKIRRVQPHGPYLLGGLCAGGVIAYEIARQLQKEGEQIAMLALIDAADVGVQQKAGRVAGKRLKSFSNAFSTEQHRSLGEGVLKATAKVKNLLVYEVSSRLRSREVANKVRQLRQHLDAGSTPPEPLQTLTVADIYQFALLDDTNRDVLDGDVALFRATTAGDTQDDEPYIEKFDDPLLGWPQRISGTVQVFDITGGHFSMLQEPHAQALAQSMQAYIDSALAAAMAASGPKADVDSNGQGSGTAQGDRSAIRA